MSELIAFVRARLDEDYEVAWGAASSPWREGSGGGKVLDRHGDITAVCAYGGTFGHILRFDPTGVIRIIEAHRRILELCDDAWGPQLHSEWGKHMRGGLRRAVEDIATIYAEHPNFTAEWDHRRKPTTRPTPARAAETAHDEQAAVAAAEGSEL